MKGLVKTSLATALALATGQAFALGLGPIQVRSGLNQPLVAEIPVLADSAAEANDLHVDLASAEDFQRVGLSRGRVSVPLEFSIGSNGRGQTVIKVTTKDIVREPFLDFLIEVNWSKGKLMREYTVLLDPPVTAPAVVTTNRPTAHPVVPAAVERAPAPAPTRAEPHPVSENPAPVPAPASAPAMRPGPAAARAPVEGGQYGPVQRGQALSTIARGLDVTTPLNINQVMLALLKANPSAFYKDNVNALKTGAVLRIPSSEEVAATGSLREAAVAMQAQNQSWADIAKPTQVNDAGAPTAPAAVEAPSKAAHATKPEHLALVPPQSDKGGESGSGSSGSGSAKEAAEARADLARTKETLANKEQESAELKSRVKQLEDINDKGQHLISLKDSEIAELQNKLKELQAKAATAPSTAAVTIKPAEPPKPAEVPAVPPLPAKTETPAAPAASTANVADTTAAAKAAAEATTAPTTAPATTPAPAPAPAASAPVSPGVTVTPLPDATTTSSAPAASTPPPAPAPAPVKPKPVTQAPAPVAKPWWSDYLGDSPYPLYGLGAVLLLLGAWAASKLFGKPKTSSVRPAYRDLNDESEPADAVVPPANEQQLLDHLAEHPDDHDASMELLRHYYVQGDATHFESLAESLQPHLPADSAQWEEVLAMGRDLAPHHHLFVEPAHDAFAEHAHEAAAPVVGETYRTVVDQPRPDLDATQHFDFEDLHAHAADAAHDHADHAAHDLDEPHVHEIEMTPVHEPVRAAPVVHVADDGEAEHEAAATEFFTGEDTISTRLDLARAYLDMGDPEGARSMLDEVLAEGNAAQKEEARKLLSEIR